VSVLPSRNPFISWPESFPKVWAKSQPGNRMRWGDCL
jgi:hypothetical protein